MKFRMTRAYVRTLIAEALEAKATNLEIPFKVIRAGDLTKLIQAGFTYDRNQALLTYPVANVESLDVDTLKFPEAPTEEELRTMEIALGSADTDEDEDEDEEQEPAGDQQGGAAPPHREAPTTHPTGSPLNLPAGGSPTTPATPAGPVTVPSVPAMRTQHVSVAMSADQGSLTLERQLAETQDMLRRMVLGTRRQQAAQVLADAAKRGVTAPVLNFGRLLFTALENQLSTEPVLKLSEDDGGTELDDYGACSYLFSLIDGTVPIQPRADSGVTSNDPPGGKTVDMDAVRATARRLMPKK